MSPGLRGTERRLLIIEFRPSPCPLRIACSVLISEEGQTGGGIKSRQAMAKQLKGPTPAVAYFRTSSAANVGEDKDSEKRQRAAIASFADRAGFEVVAEFSDTAVNGDDDLVDRPGLSALLDRIEANGVRVVLVEDASRFARKVLTQELGIVALQTRGVAVWSARGEFDLTQTDDEFKVAMRQIAAVFAELEKKRLVRKLRAARERKRATGVKVEGRKSHAEKRPQVVALAKQLRRRRPKGGQRSLRQIAAELFQAGHANSKGRPFTPQVIADMLAS